MPRPDRRRLLVPALALIAGLLFVSGCSRLTFDRQNFERKGYDQTARDVEVSDRAVDRAIGHLDVACGLVVALALEVLAVERQPTAAGHEQKAGDQRQRGYEQAPAVRPRHRPPPGPRAAC